MNTYCTPTIFKERLGDGRKIPIILYELNPLRDPNFRINYYRNDFNCRDKLDRTLPLFINPKKKKNRKIKSARNVKSVLHNSLYSKYLLRINFERPREIKNEDGVIISRHFRSLYINSKEYPKSKINSFSFDKTNSNRKVNFNDLNNKYKSHYGNFFSTEVKFNSLLNKTSKYINNLKNGNNLKELYFFNHDFSKTSFSTKTNNYLTNKSRNHNENTKNNNLNSTKNSKKRSKYQNKVSPLLFKSN